MMRSSVVISFMLLFLKNCHGNVPHIQMDSREDEVEIIINSKTGTDDYYQSDITARITIDGVVVDLNLRKNPDITEDVPVFLQLDGKIRRFRFSTKEAVSVYQDKQYEASFLIWNMKEEPKNNQNMYNMFGTFLFRNQTYLIQPPDTSSHSRHTIAKSHGGEMPTKNDYVLPPGYDQRVSRRQNSRFQFDSKSRSKRQTTVYEVEILIVVDYSIYTYWYEKTTGTASERSTATINTIKQFYSFVMSGINLRYQSVASSGAGFSITCLYAGIYIATTSSAAPFVEDNILVAGTSTARAQIDALIVLPTFRTWANDNLNNVVFEYDHAMLFSAYDLVSVSNGEIFASTAGLAYVSALCGSAKYSVNEDHFLAGLVTIAAHELGHNLGAGHDGDGNTCSDTAGFVMAASISTKENNTNRWIFSSCSIDAFERFIDEFETSSTTNCMTSRSSNYNASALDAFANDVPGQVYDADYQCVETEGEGSYLYRATYEGNYTGVCQRLACYVPGTSISSVSFSYIIPWEGTTCGNGKFCEASNCVSSANAPTGLTDSCPFGDVPYNVPFQTQNCTEFLGDISNAGLCGVSTYELSCCATCGAHKQRFAHVEDCEYGDKANGCQVQGCSTYSAVNLALCCGTCVPATTTSTTTTTTPTTTTTTPTTTTTTPTTTTTTPTTTTTTPTTTTTTPTTATTTPTTTTTTPTTTTKTPTTTTTTPTTTTTTPTTPTTTPTTTTTTPTTTTTTPTTPTTTPTTTTTTPTTTTTTPTTTTTTPTTTTTTPTTTTTTTPTTTTTTPTTTTTTPTTTTTTQRTTTTTPTTTTTTPTTTTTTPTTTTTTPTTTPTATPTTTTTTPTTTTTTPTTTTTTPTTTTTTPTTTTTTPTTTTTTPTTTTTTPTTTTTIPSTTTTTPTTTTTTPTTTTTTPTTTTTTPTTTTTTPTTTTTTPTTTTTTPTTTTTTPTTTTTTPTTTTTTPITTTTTPTTTTTTPTTTTTTPTTTTTTPTTTTTTPTTTTTTPTTTTTTPTTTTTTPTTTTTTPTTTTTTPTTTTTTPTTTTTTPTTTTTTPTTTTTTPTTTTTTPTTTTTTPTTTTTTPTTTTTTTMSSTLSSSAATTTGRRRVTITISFPIFANGDLGNPNSARYILLEFQISNQLRAIYLVFLGPRYRNIRIVSLRPGSVIVNYEVEVDDDPAATSDLNKANVGLITGDQTITVDNQTVSATYVEIAYVTVTYDTVAENVCALFTASGGCASGDSCVVVDGQAACQLEKTTSGIALVLALAIGLPVFLILVLVFIGLKLRAGRLKKLDKTTMKHLESSSRSDRINPNASKQSFPPMIPYGGISRWNESAYKTDIPHYLRISHSSGQSRNYGNTHDVSQSPGDTKPKDHHTDKRSGETHHKDRRFGDKHRNRDRQDTLQTHAYVNKAADFDSMMASTYT